MRTLTFTSCKEPWTAIDITEKIREQIAPNEDGFVLVYTPHTSTAIRIGKNTEELLQDYSRTAQTMLSCARPYQHRSGIHESGEQHAFCFIAGFEVLIPVENGELKLGDDQHIFYFDSTGEERERNIWIFDMKGECR